MFALMPWRREREALRPAEYPLATMPFEFPALFDRLFPRWPDLPEEIMPERPWNLEVTEAENEVVVRMEVPGFEPEDFRVEVRGDRLFVMAEHTIAPTAPREEATERRMRRYERVLILPEGIEVAKVAARYHSGVLEVRLPRMEEMRPRRVPVVA